MQHYTKKKQQKAIKLINTTAKAECVYIYVYKNWSCIIIACTFIYDKCIILIKYIQLIS